MWNPYTDLYLLTYNYDRQIIKPWEFRSLGAILLLRHITEISFMLSCFSPPVAGYNNLEVAEYLLEHGADVNAQDKGGLIPLHNAASYGVSPHQVYIRPWNPLYMLYGLT